MTSGRLGRATSMAFVVIVILIGILPASIAQKKGRSFVLWWIFGSALFIVALPAAFLISDRSYAPPIRTRAGFCTSCGTGLAANMAHCYGCGSRNGSEVSEHNPLKRAAVMLVVALTIVLLMKLFSS